MATALPGVIRETFHLGQTVGQASPFALLCRESPWFRFHAPYLAAARRAIPANAAIILQSEPGADPWFVPYYLAPRPVYLDLPAVHRRFSAGERPCFLMRIFRKDGRLQASWAPFPPSVDRRP